MVGQWTHRCAEQLAVHDGPLISDEVKSIAHVHNASPKGVHTVGRKLRKAGIWDDIKGGSVTLDVIDDVHLTTKKGDDATDGEGGTDKSDKGNGQSKVTSEGTPTDKKPPQDVRTDSKTVSTRQSTPKGGKPLTADQFAKLLELPEEERRK